MNIYIYLDDVREDDNWFNSHLDRRLWHPMVARTYNEVVDLLEMCRDDEVILDLDHDLGETEDGYNEEERTGYDVCKFVVESGIGLVGYHIHSMNPVGARRMRELLDEFGYREME